MTTLEIWMGIAIIVLFVWNITKTVNAIVLEQWIEELKSKVRRVETDNSCRQAIENMRYPDKMKALELETLTKSLKSRVVSLEKYLDIEYCPAKEEIVKEHHRAKE